MVRLVKLKIVLVVCFIEVCGVYFKEEFVDILGVNLGIYVNYECGVNEFKVELFVRIVKVCGIDLYWFLIGELVFSM